MPRFSMFYASTEIDGSPAVRRDVDCDLAYYADFPVLNAVGEPVLSDWVRVAVVGEVAEIYDGFVVRTE